MKHGLPYFRKGDVLVWCGEHRTLGETFTLCTDQITLLEDTHPEDAVRVRTPAEGLLLITVEYIGDREKINGRWVVPVKRSQMDNVRILHNYELKGGQPSLI